jgi:hypothetical protein
LGPPNFCPFSNISTGNAIKNRKNAVDILTCREYNIQNLGEYQMLITYSKKRKWKDEHVEEAVAAACWAIKYYNLEGVSVHLKLKETLFEDAQAYCEREGKGLYTIELGKRAVEDDVLLQTIFHEMTHVKQYEREGLKIKVRHGKFKGETYSLEKDEDYWLSPWEMEARAMEDAMINFYNRSQNEKD